MSASRRFGQTKPLTILFLTALVLGAGGCFLLSTVQVNHWEEGINAFRGKQYDQAMGHFQKVSQGDEHYQVAQCMIARVWQMKEQYKSAYRQFRQARKLNPAKFERVCVENMGAVYGELTKSWSFKVEGKVSTLYQSGQYFVVTEGNQLGVIDKESQRLLWERRVNSRSGAMIMSKPYMDDNHIYLTEVEASQSFLRALKLKSGRVAWEQSLGEGTYEFSNSCMAGEVIYAGGGEGYHKPGWIGAFNASNGKRKWKKPIDNLPGSMIYTGKYVCTQTDEEKVFCLKPGGRKPWTYKLGGNACGLTPGASTDMLFIVTGDCAGPDSSVLFALNIGDEAGLAWKKSGLRFPSPALVLEERGLVLIKSADDTKAFDMKTGKGVWVHTDPEGTRGMQSSEPPAANDKMVVGWTKEWVFGLSLKSGKTLWQAFFPDQYILAAPIISGDEVVFPLSDRNGFKLMAIKPQKPSKL